MENLVWYACYGSNILSERFHLYIRGGYYATNGKTHNGCTDKTLPRNAKPILIPYESYYGQQSGSWVYQGRKCGVAFLDKTRPAVTVGRAYLITEEQFEEVRSQEGAGWYDERIFLGVDDGYKIYTFTHSTRYNDNIPSPDYLNVIKQGMREMISGTILP